MFLWPMHLWSIAAHHGESADPRLLGWIKHLFDQVITVGPWTVVVGLGLIIVAIPVAVVAAYLFQRGRYPGGLGKKT
ncbi:MAG: hypothetical protein IIC99_09875 [Chloroflexi bacterium]|nr:hypothetical protein [Chloroflexota bacterium]